MGVAESAGRGCTKSDSDTARWTGMGVVSAKSAYYSHHKLVVKTYNGLTLMAKVYGPIHSLLPWPAPVIVTLSATVFSVMTV